MRRSNEIIDEEDVAAIKSEYEINRIIQYSLDHPHLSYLEVYLLDRYNNQAATLLPALESSWRGLL